jgi:hypothetical protein
MTPRPAQISHEYQLDFGRQVHRDAQRARRQSIVAGFHPHSRGARGHPAPGARAVTKAANTNGESADIEVRNAR